MSDILKAVLLGVVQGLTEFLPVSSTGHLVITEKILGVSRDEFGLRFDAAIHLGTLTAVIIYFRATVFELTKSWLASVRARRWDVTPPARLAWLLVIGTIPAGLAGIAIESTAEDAFRSPALVATMLILFCLPLMLAERIGKQDRDVDSARPLDALLLGVAQSIALVPGVSRSGITISAAMFAGFKREQAAVFTFLLSAPIIAAAGGKQLFDIARGDGGGGGLENELLVYGVGLITAGIVGYAAIAFLVRFLRTNPLHLFVAYRIIFGATILGLVVTNVL
ncbi:MAG TPA: undecaprenyl-diphosphatase UppP [Dehalococcoidia bacterium]|nr:undecaprenyl-diphosphatase UppP [Dehalococcoidia bacterium]